jgi:pimeloyl-ACP methyl ester carboxylesterase
MDGIQARQYGTRPSGVAVVHGGPGAAGHMAPVAARLAAAGPGVLEPLQTATSVNGQVEELRAAIARLASRPVVVIGHSWGAWLSCLIAAEHPDLVRKLILVGTPPFEARYVPRLRENRMRGLTEAERAEFASLADALNHSAPEQAAQYLRRLGELAGRGDTYAPLDSAASPSIPGLLERSGEIYAAV